jgi:hypothetical protein
MPHARNPQSPTSEISKPNAVKADFSSRGNSATRPLRTATINSKPFRLLEPIHGMSTRLTMSAPTIPPSVLAA